MMAVWKTKTLGKTKDQVVFNILLYRLQSLIVLVDKWNQLQQFGCRECHQLHLQVGQDLQAQMRVYYACDFEAFA